MISLAKQLSAKDVVFLVHIQKAWSDCMKIPLKWN